MAQEAGAVAQQGEWGPGGGAIEQQQQLAEAQPLPAARWAQQAEQLQSIAPAPTPDEDAQSIAALLSAPPAAPAAPPAAPPSAEGSCVSSWEARGLNPPTPPVFDLKAARSPQSHPAEGHLAEGHLAEGHPSARPPPSAQADGDGGPPPGDSLSPRLGVCSPRYGTAAPSVRLPGPLLTRPLPARANGALPPASPGAAPPVGSEFKFYQPQTPVSAGSGRHSPRATRRVLSSVVQFEQPLAQPGARPRTPRRRVDGTAHFTSPAYQ